ncbi:type VI secretion system membrane subunit TssM [Mesorhizobium sp. CAU 1741]|uniref:type VI secretion system membrane subunit TssM n=1 Tax=Mesorhizobium sp. CAU 1741 TaxID=3140366 RepID=UPI00325C33D7
MSMRARLGRIGRALVSPAALLTIATALLALFVWFVGPLLSVAGTQPLSPVSIRLALVLVLVLVWGVAGYFIRVRRSNEDQALLAALRRQREEEQQAAAQEQAAEKSRFDAFRDAARDAVRFSRAGSGFLSREGYRLPWYLLLGTDGAGKTSLVMQSGLTLPYQERDATGDALADFHVTDQAVLTEIDGSFLEQSEQADTPLWLRMLDHLRRLRSRQPINGIIVAVSAGELLAMTPEAALDYSSTVRRRLDEAGMRLRARVPVYLVVTKLDLVVGFEEFFEPLGAQDRAAVFGVPLDAGGQERREGFEAGFAAIIQRLSDQLLVRLQEEPDEQRRRRLHEFPAQFAALGTVLEPLISYVTAQHRFGAPPRVRGLFFASAAQNRLSIDPLSVQLAAGFAQRPANLMLREDEGRKASRPYFLQDLFRGVILPEASLGSLTRPAVMFSRARGIAANVALTLIAFGLLAAWWLSFSEGRAYTGRLADGFVQARSSLDAAEPEDGRAAEFGRVLTALDDLRELSQERPTRATLGLYSTASARREARDAYERGIAQLLVPYVWRYLRDDVADPGIAAAIRFQQLKLYLMMVGERPVDAATAASMAPDFTARWLPGEITASVDARVARHLAELAYVEMPPLIYDMPLVDGARALLSEYSLARLAYDRLAARPAIEALALWRPVDHMALTGPQALARVSGASFWDGISGQFTRDGFFNAVQDEARTAAAVLADDLWVMGVPDTLADRERETRRIRDGLLDLYRVDYIRIWDNLLSDLAMTQGADAAEVARAFAIIIGKPSPIQELMTAIVRETDLTREPNALDAVSDLASQRAAQAAGDAYQPRRMEDIGAAVTAHFRAFREAVVAEEGQQSQLDAMLAWLEPLYRQINHIAAGGDILELGAEPQTVLAQLTEQASTLPESMQPLFRRIIAQAAAITGGSSRERLSQIWNTTILPACVATTRGRYPFDPGSSNDASIADFASVFGPAGLIAQFRNDYLRPYIDTNASPWRWRPGQQASLGIADEVLAELELADRITTAYFGGAETPSVDFTVEPVRLDPAARAFQFDIGGPTLVYQHGPPSPSPFKWPPDRVDADAILSVTPEVQGERNMVRRQGPWALFRLFDAGRIMRPDATDVVPYTFSVGSRQVILNVTAPATRNPFARDILSDFSCPSF